MPVGAVRIEGLADLRRALRRADRALARGVPVALKDSASMAANIVRRHAPRGPSGRLAGSVKPFARANYAGVRVTATRSSAKYPNYPYPRRQNYDPRSPNKGFMEDALEEARPRIERRMSFVLDDIAENWGI